MILNTSYMCLLHSRFIKNHPIWILKDESLISDVILSHLCVVGPLTPTGRLPSGGHRRPTHHPRGCPFSQQVPAPGTPPTNFFEGKALDRLGFDMKFET
jgi:hypothetical protein